MTTTPPVVTIESWRHPAYGDRYTVMVDDRPIATFGTEAEARQKCREHGWTAAHHARSTHSTRRLAQGKLGREGRQGA